MSLPLTKRWRARIESVGAELTSADSVLGNWLSSIGAASVERQRVGLRNYLAETVNRAGSVRTILYRDAAVPLHRLHVPGLFALNDTVYSEGDLFRHIVRRRRIIISGNAGTGKSVFTKRLTLKQLELSVPRFPILVEMRFISASETSILHYIRDELVGIHLPSFNDEILDLLFRSGNVTLILDGFDETHFARRDMYRREIDWISRRFPEMEIILSTRPEEETLGLVGFEVVRVLPLPLEAAQKLVAKLAYDPSVRSSFLAALPRIYEEHFELASNPLLLTMLLLTHDQVGEIPAKMHIFYNQAFETLVLKHDRLKSHYVRVTRCAIDLESLKRAYSYFCAVSYASFEISFSEARCIELLRESLDFTRLDADPDDFLRDLLFNYSMLKRDGLYISFVHRSFQEFFCALFVSNMSPDELGLAFDQLVERETADSCVRMLCDLTPDKVLFGWAKPVVQKLVDRLQRAASSRAVASFARDFYGTIRASRTGTLDTCSSTPLLAKLRLYMEMIADQDGLALLQRSSGQTNSKRMKGFFGERPPFELNEIEPMVEDDAWMRGSWLEEQMHALLEHLLRALEWIDEVAARRSEKVKISFAGPEKERQRSLHYEFKVKGAPRKIADERTGREKSVPREVLTYRWGPDPKQRNKR